MHGYDIPMQTSKIGPWMRPRSEHPPSICGKILSASGCHSPRPDLGLQSQQQVVHIFHICDAPHSFHPNFSFHGINVCGPAHHSGSSARRDRTCFVGNRRLPALQMQECNLLQSALVCSNPSWLSQADHRKEK